LPAWIRESEIIRNALFQKRITDFLNKPSLS
jgi:hypothetical protein